MSSDIIKMENAKYQTAAQVQVSLDSAMNDMIFDSDKRTDIDSICYPLDIKLSPYTSYRNPEARTIVETCLPGITGSMLFTMFAGERSVLDFIKQGLVKLDEIGQKELDEKLRCIK